MSGVPPHLPQRRLGPLGDLGVGVVHIRYPRLGYTVGMRVVLGFVCGVAVGVLTSGQVGRGFVSFLDMVESRPDDDFGVWYGMSVMMFVWLLLLGGAGVLVARRLGKGSVDSNGSP